MRKQEPRILRAGESTTNPEASFQGKKLLICEDDTNTAIRLYELGRQLGIHIVGTVTTGQEAIEIATQHRPDLIFLNTLLPDMDGIAAALHILSVYSPFILLLTTLAPDQVRQRLVGVAIGGVLTKPFRNEDVIALLHRYRGEPPGKPAA